MVSSFKLTFVSANPPRPPDLTPYLTKVHGQYVAGWFSGIYRGWYRDGCGLQKEVRVRCATHAASYLPLVQVAVKALRTKFAIDEDENGGPVDSEVTHIIHSQ